MAIKFYLASSSTKILLHLQFIGGSNTSGKPHSSCSLVSNPSASKLFTAVTAVQQEPVQLPWNSTVTEGKCRDRERCNLPVSPDSKTGKEQERSFWGEVNYLSSGLNDGFKQFYELTRGATSSPSIWFSILMWSISDLQQLGQETRNLFAFSFINESCLYFSSPSVKKKHTYKYLFAFVSTPASGRQH